ncbi:MAG TPA: MotA/TolQ/ExbB proton channel family protein [Planctomycetes bacterium]|nr:MotA/TolQ/ExbB proton channel family protein [Planctomycetota bacterium]HIN80906.1 MotA/TolQ/ExbB proton channel family protein [Planctomycetota bacterium]
MSVLARVRRITVLGVVLVLLLTTVAPLLAQDGGDTPGVQTKTVLDNINDGGVVGYIIIGLSIAGVSLIIMYAMSMRRDVLVPPELLAHVEGLFDEEDYESALDALEQEQSFLSSVLAAGLPKIDRPYEDIELAMEEAGDQEASSLHQKISYLSLIAAVSPMLGLLGTVKGMVVAFNKIAASKTSPKPAELADGISEALMTTMMGLIVAIPMTVSYFLFKNRIDTATLEVSNIATELMERFDVSEAQ